MSNHRNRKKKRNAVKRGVPFIVVAVALFCSVVGVKSYILYGEKKELAKKHEILDNRIAVEEQRKEDLEEQEKYMQTKKFVEDTAKSKLGLVYPDEIIIQPDNK